MPTCRPDERQRFCEQCCVKLSLANLAGFPWVAERVADGDLKLHGAYFGVATGRLEMLGRRRHLQART